MLPKSLELEGNQFVLRTAGTICSNTHELASSDAFEIIVERYIEKLRERKSPILAQLYLDSEDPTTTKHLIETLRNLASVPLDQVVKTLPYTENYLSRRRALHEFVEGLYDFWRSYDRFMICHSEKGPNSYDQRPYRTFNTTVEQLNHLVRALYRDICENITGDHPRVYRQVSAGCDIALIAVEKSWKPPAAHYDCLRTAPFIRQVLLNSPLVLNPSPSKRTEQFRKVSTNPILGIELDSSTWLCYPAQVGRLVVFIYFHRKFVGLGCSLANLLEIASDAQISDGPDAICVYGVPTEQMRCFGDPPTVFYDDEENNVIVAAVPDDERFSSFSYLREMVLVAHNAAVIKRGKMPFHGSMIKIELSNGRSANVVLIGSDTAGRTELIEAIGSSEDKMVSGLKIIANDMGSLEVTQDGAVLGFGTETGAFVSLSNLQRGDIMNQIDRAIIMNPATSSARVILPVTMIEDLQQGYPVDILLYTNNYEEIDSQHPTIERFSDPKRAIETFAEGATMTKGTTLSTGVSYTYFANRYGVADYKDAHEILAQQVFEAAFKRKLFVGQIRTRVGIRRYGERGPHIAAQELLGLIDAGWE